MRRTLIFLLALTPSCSPTNNGAAVAPQTVESQPSSNAPALQLPADEDLHYGIYLNGSKVGWMRSQTITGETVSMKTEVEARVGGMGIVSKVELVEEREFDAKSGKLRRISFEQKAATGSVRVQGEVEGATLHLKIAAGGQKGEMRVAVEESLEDALLVQKLAAAAKVGAKAEGKRFDASMQKQVKMQHEVKAVESRMFGGVATRAVRIESSYPELGIQESAWVTVSGTVLESQVGGFFVARLESPEDAKRLDYSQDLLVSAVVKSPVALVDAGSMETLSLTFTGFDGTLPPSSTRQKVTQQQQQVLLSLTRDKPPESTLPIEIGADLAEYVKATPFVQSDAAAIRERAKAVVGDSRELFAATSKLSSFVHGHVRDEYVPAYSNALEALNTGRGDCTEHSILFVAMARALGIPARVAVGIAYWPPGGGFGWHAWAEVHDGKDWYAVDPTWDQPIADVTHVKLAGGGPAEQARIVMLLGKLRLVNVVR